MNSVDKIEKTLSALLLNASDIQLEDDPIAIAEISNQQQRLLDTLFEEWDRLDEKERTQSLLLNIEDKVLKFSKKNQACLKEVQEKRKTSRKHRPLMFSQLTLNFTA
jgi:hypothetical protein